MEMMLINQIVRDIFVECKQLTAIYSNDIMLE